MHMLGHGPLFSEQFLATRWDSETLSTFLMLWVPQLNLALLADHQRPHGLRLVWDLSSLNLLPHCGTSDFHPAERNFTGSEQGSQFNSEMPLGLRDITCLPSLVVSIVSQLLNFRGEAGPLRVLV